MNKRTAHSLNIETLRNLYRFCRTEVCKRDNISASEFDEDCAEKAKRYVGWSYAAAMVSAAVTDYSNGFSVTHHHISPETLECGGYLSGDVFTTSTWTAASERNLIAKCAA